MEDIESITAEGGTEIPPETAQPVRKFAVVNRYLATVSRVEGSDLHLKADVTPRIRKSGRLFPVTGGALSNEAIEAMVREILSPEQWHTFCQRGTVDIAYAASISERFRINIFRQRGQTSLSARRINPKIPTFQELNLPPVLAKMVEFDHGLVLVCGMTGVGKSTTLASMIQQINEQRASHIITIEDPIEYLYVDQKAFINQREIGLDVESYEMAVRSLMREDPDVILIGEMRDRLTFQAGIQAAETGHLVMSTVHSSSAAGAITRILELFPAEMHTNIRLMIVANLRAILYQKLVPSVKAGVERVPAVEVVFSSPAVRQYIEEGRESELTSVIRAEKGTGMIDFNDYLADLVQQEVIASKEAFLASPNPDELRMRLRGIKTS